MIVPLFHANSWGLAFSALMTGSRLVLPGPALDGASVHRLMEGQRVTVTAAVPTVWLLLLAHLEATGGKLSTLKKARARARERAGSSLRFLHFSRRLFSVAAHLLCRLC